MQKKAGRERLDLRATWTPMRNIENLYLLEVHQAENSQVP